MKKLAFRSALSRVSRNGVTLPCGLSCEYPQAKECARRQGQSERCSKMCEVCAISLAKIGSKIRSHR